MLKIRDDVDLKELEKFGFKETIKKGVEMVVNGDVAIYKRDKILRNNCWMDLLELNNYLDITYDLIKADLVEKVDD